MKKIFYMPIILFGSWYLLLVGFMSSPWLNVFQQWLGFGLGGLTIIAGAICLTGTASDLRANKRRKMCLLLLSVCYFIFIFLFSLNGFYWLQTFYMPDLDLCHLSSVYYYNYEQYYHLVYITCFPPIYYLFLLVIMDAKDPIIISSKIEEIPETPEIQKSGDSYDEPEHDSKLLGTLKTGINKNRTAASTPHSGAEWTCPRCETINHVTDESCKVCGHSRV